MPATDDFDRMTVKELRQLAQEQGITKISALRKAELIAVLRSSIGPREPLALATSAPADDLPSSSVGSTAAAAPIHPHGDPGLPIPPHYGDDRLVMLVQDPQHLFAYWEISDACLARARAYLGHDGTPVLVLHAHGGVEQREVDLRGGNYYITVAPGQRYHAELALRGPDGTLAMLIKSNPVETPRLGPSDRYDEEWMSIDETFNELLVRAGLADQPSSAALLRDRHMTNHLWQRVGAVNPWSGTLPSSSALSSRAAKR